MADELSISLWDLWSFGGLPIKGDFYEERIPSLKELTSTSRDKTKYLPTTCQYLFQASYDKPTTQKQKKASRSKSTQNPDGSKIQAHEWSSKESMLFAELGIMDDLKDETYLAAFLSYWLCLFVFSHKGSFLRPGVFRAASLMAAGTIYNLAIPVLANIYHGLGLITKASNLIGRMDFHFPMPYVHGWLAHYFGTHYPLPTEVRGPCKHVTQRFTDWWTMRHMTYFEENRHHLVSSAIPPPSQPRLPKNRGSNLGGKEIRLVEAMAPNLEEEVNEHKDESDSSKSDRHWKRPLKKAKVSGDNPDGRGLSALIVPDVPPLSPLNDHLEGLIALDSDESLMGPHAVDSAFEEVGTSKTPVNKPTEQSLRPSALLEEIRRGKMIVGGKDLESPSSKEGACPKSSLQKVSSAHAPLKFYELPLDKARQLNEKTSAIKEALTLVKELRGDAKLFRKEPRTKAIDQQELEIAKLQDEVNTLENTPAITEEAIEALATVRKSMEATREEFKNFKWKL
ncbi:hypothetical protein E5676_scaffold970G00390 [Cucumis melo var. makuwa]|uniref:Uncharacterized protein n=1 Tax=Cucumis melo var. makuwa TaxID=1194695 RepID=A0A5A7UVX0_CUCMM|nr:hypothetical protein E6C27_scaffold126G00510 [Cucumis melo var. makuwa]TYK27485.1 hypothetical protein E5676_scaffold970G00390 [Cucumis melo var. makuwa]